MTGRVLVAGVDSSTQATKVVVVDAMTGETVRAGRASHPDTTEVDPEHWWAAWQQASSGLLDDVAALAVAGQQHGMVLLDGEGSVVRDALLWNDSRSDVACADLLDELGGPQAWVEATGSVPVPSFTVTKLRWVRDHDSDAAERAAAVALPHDWLTHRLASWRGGRAGLEGLSTDRGDASGTGWWSATGDGYRPELLRRAFGRDLTLPRIAGPGEVVGETADGMALGAGTGDNMAAALGLDLGPGDVVVSLGTSGTAFACTATPTADPAGLVAGFADASGRYLPLVCTLNAARVMSAGASLLGVDLPTFDDLACSSTSAGLVLLPYLDGERTPQLPHATGAVYGLTRATSTPGHVARATVEGMLCALADALDALRSQEVAVHRVLLIGGAAQSRAVQGLAPALFGCDVVLPRASEYVAVGAARQAGWALAASASPPTWERRLSPAPAPLLDEPGAADVRHRYADLAAELTGLTARRRSWT